MQSIFEQLAAITKPETMKRYIVKTETKGILSFDELPKGTYFQIGCHLIEDKGLAMYYTWDNGTCLIPIIDTHTGQQVKDLSKAGKSIL